METLRKLAVPLVVIALVTAAAVTMFSGSDSKRLVAHFPRTISVYEGSEVRVLGVPIGAVESVEPSGTDVVVTMTYDSEVKLPADAKAAIVAPSIVGDRYVQVTPVYTGGEVLADDVELPSTQTAVPARARPDLREPRHPQRRARPQRRQPQRSALRPARGHGRQLRRPGRRPATPPSATSPGSPPPWTTTRRSCSAAPSSSASSSAPSPRTTRPSAASTSRSPTCPACSRASGRSSRPPCEPVDRAHRGVVVRRRTTARSWAATSPGLNRVSKVLVKQRDALDEILKVGPLALNNLALTYNPQAGTLDTRANHRRAPRPDRGRPRDVPLRAHQPGQGRRPACATRSSRCCRARRRCPQGRRRRRRPDQQFDPTLGGLVEVQR